MKNRVLSLLITLIMLVGLVPTLALADETKSVFDGISYKDATILNGITLGDNGTNGAAASRSVGFENVDFGMLGLKGFTARVATSSPYHGQYLYFHIDSKDAAPFARVLVSKGSGWASYNEYEAELLDPNVSGVHTVYVTFQGDGAGNLQSFAGIPAVVAGSGPVIPETVLAEGLEKEYAALLALDIIVEDEKFDTTKVVTVREMAKAVLMMIGEKDSYAIEDMISLIKVDQASPITVEKACEMITYMLNRQMLMSEGQSFYEYTRTLEIEGNLAPSAEVTWAEAMRLLITAIEVPPVVMVGANSKDENKVIGNYVTRENSTLLTEYRNIHKSMGIVTMDTVTGIMKDSDIPQGSVLINDYIFDVGECNVAGLLGYHVNYYYKASSHENTLLYIEKSDRNNVTTFTASEYEKYEGGYIYYEKGKTISKLELASDAAVIYNGVALASFSDATFNIGGGNLELISNNRDENCDVIKIWDTKDYVFGANDSGVLNFKDAGDGALVIDTNDASVEVTCMLVVDLVIDQSRLQEGAICTVAATTSLSGKQVYNVWLSTTSVSGRAASVDLTAQTVEIAGEEYGISSTFIKSGSSALKSGAEIKAYLNVYNEVASVASNVVSDKIGVIARTYVSDDDENDKFIKIFNSDGEWQTLTISKNIKIDGVKAASLTAAYNILTGYVGDNTKTLCIYSTNSKSELTNIRFAKSNDAEMSKTVDRDESNGLYLYKSFSDAQYYNQNQTLEKKYRLAGDWKRFIVPNDRGNVDKYSVTTAKFTHGQHVAIDLYDTQIAQLDISFGVTYTNEGAVTNAVPSSVGDVYYIDRIKQEWNGEYAQYTIDYYTGEKGELVSLGVTESLSNDPIMSTLKVGDGIAIATSGGKISGIKRMFSPAEGKKPFYNVDYWTWSPNDLCVMGYVEQKKGSIMTLELHPLYLQSGKTLLDMAYDTSKPSIYVLEDGDLRKGNANDLVSGYTLSGVTGSQRGSLVYIYLNYYNIRSIVIVK